MLWREDALAAAMDMFAVGIVDGTAYGNSVILHKFIQPVRPDIETYTNGSYAWCAAFLQWCWLEAGFVPKVNLHSAYRIKSYAKKQGWEIRSTGGRVGDAVLHFDNAAETKGHVMMWLGTSAVDNRIVVIEGNFSGTYGPGRETSALVRREGVGIRIVDAAYIKYVVRPPDSAFRT